MRTDQDMKHAGNIVGVAPFGITRKDQHLIDDDAWYAGFLAKYASPFVYIAGAYSAEQLQERFQDDKGASIIRLPEPTSRWGYELNVARCLAKQLSSGQAERVIFFGYSELMLLLLAPLLIFKRCQVTLVNTNNLSQRRLDKYRWPMWLMHFLLRHRISRFIVHSTHERKMVLSRFPFLENKAVVKKHHMLLSDSKILDNVPEQVQNDKIVISCFGPIAIDKSTEVISTVINQFRMGRCNDVPVELRIFKIAREALPDDLDKLKNVTVQFFEDFLDVEEYRKKIRQSDLVVMVHTAAFEGKLSGIFCDCISLGTPFLALNIEPLSSFDKHYDGVGFLLERANKKSWQKQIAVAIDPVQLTKMRVKIAGVAQDFGESELDADYLRAFDIPIKYPRKSHQNIR